MDKCMTTGVAMRTGKLCSGVLCAAMLLCVDSSDGRDLTGAGARRADVLRCRLLSDDSLKIPRYDLRDTVQVEEWIREEAVPLPEDLDRGGYRAIPIPPAEKPDPVVKQV